MLVNIQLLRAFGAFLVLMHHALPHYQAMGGANSMLISVARWGFLGVDVFFVISGFIMAHTTMSKPRGPRSAFIFLWHRLARIFLGYWPFYALSLFVASSLGLNLSSYNLLGSFLLLLLPQPSLVLPVSWSLSYELYFYGLFFLLLWVPIRVVCRFIPVMFVMLLAVVLIFKTDVLSPLDFILSGFLLEFFAGLMIGLISNYLKDIRFRGGFVLLAIVMIALGISNEVVSLPSRALTYGAAGVFLVIHAIAAPNRIRSRLSGVANLLGNASYTIYLSHLPLISVFYLLGFRDWFAIRGAGCAELGLVAMVLVCLIFSVLFYSWIERPLYRAAINAIKKPG